MARDRAVTQDDMNAAARALNLAGKSPAELEKVMADTERSPLFAAQVIFAAAGQMLAAKRRMGASHD